MHEIHNKYRPPKSRVKGGRGKSLKLAREKKAANDSAQDPQDASTQTEPDQDPNLTPKSSKSAKKINQFKGPIGAELSDEEYYLVNSAFLRDLVSVMSCPDCGTTENEISVSEKKGFCHRFVIECKVCGKIICDSYSSKRVAATDSSSRPPFEVNKRMTTAFLDIGAGHTAMTRFCSAMTINCLESSAFYKHMHQLAEESKQMRNQILEKARQVVRTTYEELDSSVKNQEVLEITVSIDGSWHRRGHTSLYGFVAAIDVLTGLVIDYEILSKFCLMCSLAIQQHGEDTDEFREWKRQHIERQECSINFTEASGNMESAGALLMFQRSLTVAKMKYVKFLSDGDAKTLSVLNKAKPYGPDFVIEKEECVNHVSKRMGTALRSLVQENKKGGNALGGKGLGTLTDATIKKLQGFYHRALVGNIPDVKKMKRAILATIYHCASTDQKHNHSYCPAGKESWCFFNKRKAQRSKDKGTHDLMPVKLNEKVFNALLPVYKRLSSDELLNRCTKGQTQNANESLHSVIWKKCPKHIFISKTRMEIGITQGIGEFNMGCAALSLLKSDIQGHEISKVSMELDSRRDQKRLSQAAHQEATTTKRQRLMKKHCKKNKGSSLYVPGGGLDFPGFTSLFKKCHYWTSCKCMTLYFSKILPTSTYEGVLAVLLTSTFLEATQNNYGNFKLIFLGNYFLEL
ncbi:AP-1 complex subunit beta-1 [Frankliniella fusca]|uniref:AP-1 complex subunit beta-1 n=1 Tax=Frankliniella fusca TaxID=407009 RepID=A0AAE1LHU3_9NEOP|nr:AP-1 complex subunit beta-1 [Frankliniella fusca]